LLGSRKYWVAEEREGVRETTLPASVTYCPLCPKFGSSDDACRTNVGFGPAQVTTLAVEVSVCVDPTAVEVKREVKLVVYNLQVSDGNE
jgi:hypothetical protein